MATARRSTMHYDQVEHLIRCELFPVRLDDGQQQVADQRQPWPREHQDSPERPAVCNPARFDPFELESLVLNLDASLRIRARHQFFAWTQGTLQSLIEHQLLFCATHNGGPAKFHVDSFSTVPVEPAHFSELFRQDVSLVPHLIKSWEENHSGVVSCEAGGNGGGQFAGSALARELTQLGADHIVAHGTHDATGELTSFFAFACRPGAIGPRQAYNVELLVPFLHSAWIRTQVNWQAKSPGVKPTGVLTPREQEILEWIYRGKSNIEVGMILKISPLTAKNHVQKILRKLDVLNRTQAVGKALALRILHA
jgi:transcriptional regulator EpsA